MMFLDRRQAELSDATLDAANLTRTTLTGATLSGATLDAADLTSAGLTDADLTSVYLTGANLFGADLTDAVGLRLPPGAFWNRETRWPTNLAATVVEQSQELAPGVYRVRGEETPDRSGTVRV
ncbi:pentapeptide repeat-containing protein [Streptomyces sp. NPDC057696]|uniref:pentapeptide repeat-containing protein n=1 Tax=unclassified Streptomyces TaxID=2593676 RepID=UPI0036C2E8AF